MAIRSSFFPPKPPAQIVDLALLMKPEAALALLRRSAPLAADSRRAPSARHQILVQLHNRGHLIPQFGSLLCSTAAVLYNSAAVHLCTENVLCGILCVLCKTDAEVQRAGAVKSSHDAPMHNIRPELHGTEIGEYPAESVPHNTVRNLRIAATGPHGCDTELHRHNRGAWESKPKPHKIESKSHTLNTQQRGDEMEQVFSHLNSHRRWPKSHGSYPILPSEESVLPRRPFIL